MGLVQENLESILSKHFELFSDRQCSEIEELLGIQLSRKNKSYCSVLASFMMGGSGGHIPELKRSNIIVKTIRLNDGGCPTESMSFPVIDYAGIIDESWSDSKTYQIFKQRFLFIFFDNTPEGLIFKKAVFWSMPHEDLDRVEQAWNKTKTQVVAGDYGSFIKKGDHPFLHIRPHGRNSQDTVLGPDGQQHGKVCFWLNNNYLFSIYKNT